MLAKRKSKILPSICNGFFDTPRLLSALLHCSVNIHLSSLELAEVRNCAKHISIVNDTYSHEKELKASQIRQEEGSYLCSAVKVMAEEINLDVAAAKRVLWTIVREWERMHEDLVKERTYTPRGCTQAVKDYMKGLEYQRSGNEQWSKTTRRYSQC